MATSVLFVGCGVEKAEKPDLDRTDEKTFEAALRTPGEWQLVQTVESPHPYADNFERLWRVNGDPNTPEMLVEFTRFELESGYDYLYVSAAGGAQRTENTGNRTSTELVVHGNSVELVLRTDESIGRYGFRANIYVRLPCACPAIYRPVCGVDGNTYGNDCPAACAGVEVAFESACNGSPWTPVSGIVESPHDYTDNFDRSWTVTEGGARFVRLHFSRIDVERGYDFVVVSDGAGNPIARYTGASQDVTTPPIEGGTAVVRLISDGSITRYGFSIDRHDVIGGCLSDNDCGSGEVCNNTIRCIRAPCFSVCEASTVYSEVTVADLEMNRDSWNGRAVRVIAEPTAHGAACTRQACSPENACCNSCSASLSIGTAISLRDENDQPLGCRGNECNWQDTCAPFPASDAGEYAIRGVFAMDTVGNGRLLIHDFSALGCRATGCSSELCANVDRITQCVVRPEHVCFHSPNASCVAQGDGHCGWTETPELLMCIDNALGERFSATDVPLAIPDNHPAGVVSRIEVPTNGALSQIMVSVDIAHTYRGDLVVRLIAPTGESFTLHNGEGGSLQDLIFVDRQISVPSLERNGQWSLSVVDRYARDIGTINAWALSFR